MINTLLQFPRNHEFMFDFHFFSCRLFFKKYALFLYNLDL
jgi:hypothetical protein